MMLLGHLHSKIGLVTGRLTLRAIFPASKKAEAGYKDSISNI